MSLPSYPIFNLLICILLVFIYVTPFYYKQGLVYRQYVDERLNFWFFLFICIVFCTFSFTTGDYFLYYDEYVKIMWRGGSKHFEDVYVWLATNYADTYHLWRAIIWGTASYLTILTFKRLGIPAMPAYAAITLFYLYTLCFMRGNLGVGIMVYGLSFLFKPLNVRSKHISIALGIALMCISYYFHKSMLLSIGLLIPALFNWNRKRLSVSFWLFPIAVMLIRIFLEYMEIHGIGNEDEQLSKSAQVYAATKRFELNAFGIFANIITYGSSYCFLVYAYKNRIMEQLPKPIRFFFNYWYVWVYIASACRFQDIGGWYFSRFMYMSNLPLAIVMGYIYYKYPSTRWIKVITIWALLGFLYPELYGVYKN